MLFFAKKKSFLKDLIPSGYVDIHSHILFGIDDGAKTVDDTAYLLTSMLSIGFEKVIATPHTLSGVWDNSPESIENSFIEVRKHLPDLADMVQLRYSSEYLMDESFSRRVQQQQLLPLKDNYVLVEMSYLNPPIQLFDLLFEMQVSGYVPVLAHPERYLFYHQNFDMYLKLKNAGCYFQMNLLSSVGYYGGAVAQVAQKLLEHGLIDFVGSDMHHKGHVAAFEKRIVFKDDSVLKGVMQNNCFFV